MRVAWFGSVRDGPIAEYSRGVLAAMVRLCEPRLFCHGPPDRLPVGIAVTDLALQPEALAEVPSFDAVFYNLGSDFREHAWILDAARIHPGIVVLHAPSMHQLFLDYYLEHLGRPELYVARMADRDGLAGLRTAHRILAPWFGSQPARPDDEEQLRYTFIDEALRSARGAVVHSRWRGAIVRGEWSGPVFEMWPPPQRPSASHIPAHGRQDAVADGPITVMSLGPIDPRAHVAEVVEVLGDDPELAAKVRYLIAGSHDPGDSYVQAVTAMIAQADLAGSVRILEELPPVEVDRLARGADVFINLRSPEDEWGPLVLMYQLLFGVPVVTYDSGSFADLPAEIVAKVAVGDRTALGETVRGLVDDAARRRAIGAAGRAFAEAGHSARDYARALLRFAGQDAAPAGGGRLTEDGWPAIAERIAGDIGASLAGLGAAADSPGVDEVIREAGALLWPPL